MNSLEFTHSNHVDSLRRQCSLQTLQQDPKGHFGKIFDHLRKRTGNYVNVLLQMSQLNSDWERIKFASGIEGMVIFLPQPVFKPKDDKIASEARERGNEEYKKGHIQKAFMNYSVAVINSQIPMDNDSSSPSSTMLAYSLGNRSACLFRMEMYREAIDDLLVALSLNYPTDARHKLYERLGRSYFAIEDFSRAKEAFKICQKLKKEDNEKFEQLLSKIETSPQKIR